MGRTSNARERLLEAGAQLLGQRPYGSVGVADICSRAGVPKGSFYYFFPSKQELVLAVIDKHWEWQRAQWQAILGSPEPVADRLHALFLGTAQIQRDAQLGTGSVQGCLFGNLALEVSATEADARARLQAIFDAQVDMLEHALGDEHSGYDAAGAELRPVATAVVAQLEGLVLFAKLFDDPSRVEDHWAVTARSLGLSPAASLQ